MDYLRWYRAIDVAVENEVEAPASKATGRVALDLKSAAGDRRLAVRRVVLATGRDGLGGSFVPEALQKSRLALLGRLAAMPSILPPSTARGSG